MWDSNPRWKRRRGRRQFMTYTARLSWPADPLLPEVNLICKTFQNMTVFPSSCDTLSLHWHIYYSLLEYKWCWTMSNIRVLNHCHSSSENQRTFAFHSTNCATITSLRRALQLWAVIDSQGRNDDEAILVWNRTQTEVSIWNCISI
jgi:hypothetical protein